MDDKFDLVLVHNNFLSSILEEDDIKLKEYLESYEELSKFFTLLGSIFSFVNNDLKDKINILYNFLKDAERAMYFTSVKSMIEHEKQNNLLYKNDYLSGSRTLLRLHRGLNFIRQFLQQIGELEEGENTGPVCRSAYDQTLAKHHSWLVRTSARLAMHTMPERQELLRKVCGGDEEINNALKCLPDMLSVVTLVYERVENLYTVSSLHNLP